MKLQLKRSNVLVSGGAKEPTAAQLDYGELAINYSAGDAAIFLKDSTNNVIRIAGVHNIADDGLTNVPTTTSPPTTPTPEAGNLWYNSEDGRLYIYYVDDNSSQWVDASPDTWQTTVIPDTTNPAHQAGTLDDRYINTNGDTLTGALKLDNAASAATPDLAFDGDLNTGIYSPGADSLAITTAGTQRVTVDSSGNVGIGTTSPSEQLHLNGGKLKIDTTSGARAITLNAPTNGCYVTFETAGTAFADIGAEKGALGTGSVDDFLINVRGSREFLVRTNSNERLRIDSSGKVGIGTTSPSAKVHITNNSNSSTQYLNSDADLLVNAAGTKGAVLKLTNGGSSTESAIVFDQSSILKFTAREYERMRIDSSGRLLVGTTTEGAANEADNVTISGTGDVGITLRSTNSAINRIYFSDGTSGTSEYAGYQLYNHSSNAMIFGTNAIERMRIDSSGNVGIGGTATGNFGAINKGVLITGTNAAVGLRVETSHSSSGILEMYAESGGSVLDTRGSGHIRFASAGTEFIRIDSSGRLLVGTSSAPAGTDAQYSRLAIRGNTINDNACYLSLGNKKTTANTTSDDNLGIITFNDSDSDAGEYARIVGASDGTNGTNDYPGKLIFSTTEDGGSSPTERMRIDSSGRLLVGTTTVGEDYADELTIANNSNCGITIRSSSSTSGNLYFSDGTSGSAQYSGAIVYSHGTNSLKLFTNGGQERMRIDAGGDVAIGMTPAGKSLSIQHAANPTLGFYTGNTLRGELNITTGETSLRSYANSPITFEVGSERMRINSAGSLLVGTSTTSSFPDRLISVGHHTRTSSYIDIRSSTVAALLFADGTSGDAAYRGQVEYHHSTDSMRFWTGANERMRIDSTGSVKVPGIYSQALSGTLRSVVARNDGYLGYNSSTRASKTNINSLDNINWLYQLNPVEFNYRKTDSETNAYTEENYEEKEYGLIAEEVETIAPDLCFYDETQEGEVLAGVHYRKMSALLLKAIQNLKADNETFQLRIAALEQRLSDAGIA